MILTSQSNFDVVGEYYSSEDDLVAYDAAGNLSADGAGYEYAYDHDNRLTAITRDDAQA